MHELNLETVNWSHPSEQNIVDLYYARMWAVSEAVAYAITYDTELSGMYLDDIRTNFLRFTKMRREQFDSLINEGAQILKKWGIPEVFVISPNHGFCNDPDGEDGYVDARIYTEEDMEQEFLDDTKSMNLAVLSIMQVDCVLDEKRSRAIDKAFSDIVNPRGRQRAN